MREHCIFINRANKVLLCALLVVLTQPVAHPVSAAVVGPVNTTDRATPAPRVVPQPNYEYIALVPVRPRGAHRIRVAVGVFGGYAFSAKMLPAEMEIWLRDPRSGKIRNFLLAFNTTLNELPLKCARTKIIENENYCAALPSEFVPGKTIIALLYWRRAFADFPLLRGTDTIVTLQP